MIILREQDKKAQPRFHYIKTFEPHEIESFLKSTETIAKKVNWQERAIHGGLCPYPIKISFWSRIFWFFRQLHNK